MSSGTGMVPATGSPGRRQFYRLTTDCVIILRNVHRFFDRERTEGRSRGFRNPVQRAAWAIGVSLSTMSRVRSDGVFDGLPQSGERERRERVPRIPDAERALLRELVYFQYRNRSLPSLESTLEYLKTANLVHNATGIGSVSSYFCTRTKLALALKEAGFFFSRGANHYAVDREDVEIKAQRTNYINTVRQYRWAGRTIYYTDETCANKSVSVYRS